MGEIHKLVKRSLDTGYLSLDTEERLRFLLQTTKYSRDDLNAFVKLQHAAIDGYVRQESRERLFQDSSINSLLIA